MKALPFFITSLLGWMVAHLISSFEREESAVTGWMRLANYPVGIAGASIGTWVSQNSAMLYNKVFVMGIFFSGIAVLLFQSLRRLLQARRKTGMISKNAFPKLP
ncbi:MAG: hypothetical protein ONB44_13685 [candidate division KSB1 bacterium]|nr:hypothetical protein [candidate division KSB1 bacterium]MDZ7303175.1 hypothetical protein [candidate division KSB1 bacterium]MDZ7310154.1 hypothetical protein [candidate division KSB1 bacterium]